MKQRLVAFLLFTLGLSTLVWHWPPDDQAELPWWISLPQRIERLQARVHQREKNLDALVLAYKPKVKGRLDDLTLAAVDLLRGMPGVAKVTSNGVQKPTARIVHFLDYHALPYHWFANLWKDVVDSRAEIDLRYEQLLLEVRLVQLDQLAALRCLILHHGLETAWAEGLTVTNLTEYRNLIAALKKDKAAGNDILAKIGPNASPEQKWNREVAKQALTLLLMRGLLKEVLAPEAPELISVFGDKVPKQHLGSARDKAIVQRMTAHGKFGVIVLGSLHDLAPYLPAGVEYLRVTMKARAGVLGN